MQRRVLGFDQRYALDPFGMRHGALIAAGNSWQAQSGYEHVRAAPAAAQPTRIAASMSASVKCHISPSARLWGIWLR